MDNLYQRCSVSTSLKKNCGGRYFISTANLQRREAGIVRRRLIQGFSPSHTAFSENARIAVPLQFSPLGLFSFFCRVSILPIALVLYYRL